MLHLNTRFKVATLAGLILLFVSGCSHTQRKSLYYWGDYESLIYQYYHSPEKALPQVQISKLTRDIQKAQAINKKIAPGVHAHLGLMYSLLGQTESAMVEFEIEKRLFPESTVFIDGLMDRAKVAADKLQSSVQKDKQNTILKNIRRADELE